MKQDTITAILELMKKKEKIRNISIVAHIDHGKTTLADHLLAEGRYLLRDYAGELRALDYLPAEQKRGITIKTANISLIYTTFEKKEQYLVNLVDTPGHVDFGQAVGQALSLVDGTIVVVDAVEGVMAQTETVLIQAIKSKVRPILFINKIDRLIKEIKLTPQQIQEQIDKIVGWINAILMQHCSAEIYEQWKLKFEENSIIIGSALDGWAISAQMLKASKITFKDIMKAYTEEKVNTLQKLLPLAKVILEAVIVNIPPPNAKPVLQKYKITSQHLDREVTRICINKLEMDKRGRIIGYGRIVTGIVKRGSQLYLFREGERTHRVKVERLNLAMGQKTINIDEAYSGNIIGISSTENFKIGDRLSSEQRIPICIAPQYRQEPVIKITIEPYKTKDIETLLSLLKQKEALDIGLTYEIEENTGEITVTAIGELQIELLIEEIQQKGIEIDRSQPRVALYERVSSFREIIEENDNKKIRMAIHSMNSVKNPVKGKVVYKDKHANEIRIIPSQVPIKALDAVKAAFSLALSQGPLQSHPLRETVLSISMLDVSGDQGELIVEFTQKIRKLIAEAQPIIVEPYYTFQITVPEQYVGEIINVLQKREATITQVTSGMRMIIEGEIAVRMTFGMASEIRSASEGYAFIQLQLQGYKELDHRYYK